VVTATKSLNGRVNYPFILTVALLQPFAEKRLKGAFALARGREHCEISKRELGIAVLGGRK
jgi:hypothetical protein